MQDLFLAVTSVQYTQENQNTDNSLYSTIVITIGIDAKMKGGQE